MKNLLISILFILITLPSLAQQEQVQYYKYNIFSFKDINTETTVMNVDNGNTIEKLKDENGKKIRFKTPAAALTYLISIGWDFYTKGESSGSTFQGTGTGSTIYWIMRKPCTKEEFEKAVQDGIEK